MLRIVQKDGGEKMGKKLGCRVLSILLTLVLALELVPGSVWAAGNDGTAQMAGNNGTAQMAGNNGTAQMAGNDGAAQMAGNDGAALSGGAGEALEGGNFPGTAIEVAEGEGSEVVLGEVDGLRAESQKHFRMADGSFLAVDYGMPVHFSSGLDEDGEPIWEEIDNTLLLQPETAQAAFSASGEADAVLGQTPASSYAAAGQNAAFSNSGAAASYAAVNGDDTKVFAGRLATGFLFSVQRGQSGVRMSLVDDEAVQPEAPTETEGATEPAIESAEGMDPGTARRKRSFPPRWQRWKTQKLPG